MIRGATADDIFAIHRFGETYIRPHYAPLIGAAAADEQVRRWWSEASLAAPVADGLVVVAEADGAIVGVGQRGRRGPDHVIYKLYLDPAYRGRRLGPRLLDALIGQLPGDVDRVLIEHFVGNARAGSFYEREGYTVERVEPDPAGDPRRGVVWRARDLGAHRAKRGSSHDRDAPSDRL